MKVLCPNCKSEIPAAKLNVETDVAVCPRCNEAFALSSLVSVENDDDCDLNDPPRGTWYLEDFGGWTLGSTTRHPMAFFLVPFMLVWSGGSLGGIYGTQIVAGKFNLFMSLFGIPFLLGTLMIGSTAVMAVCGKIVVSVDQGLGRIFTGVGPFGWTRRFDWSEIKRVEKDRWTSNNNNTPVIALVGKSRLKFGSMLKENRRDFLLQALRKLLARRGADNIDNNWIGACKHAPYTMTPLPLETIAEREGLLLAPYAMKTAASTGRRYPEPVHPYRGAFQRDRDRILHSAAFRRLSHKTQVFTGELGDYHRTRLTHTLEVASIARTLGRALKLNEDLVEALALAHDIGHPPFGHAGEDTLNECLADEGGFSHNRQALRIFEQIETRYPDFPGLNLSFEVLEGQRSRAEKATAAGSPLLEAQVVDAADSVAYDTHDADDALQLGLVSLDALLEVPLWRAAAERVRRRTAALSVETLRRAIVHELIESQVSEILSATAGRLSTAVPGSPDAVRAIAPLVAPTPELARQKTELERFLFERVYRHSTVLATRTRVQRCLGEMFEKFVASPQLLPENFAARAATVGLKRTVGDYLAGMTDRFALREHRRLLGGPDAATTGTAPAHPLE